MNNINLKRISIITGHYGSGKTNIAVNMALDIKKSGKDVTIVDLDIVNPYFRTADFKQMLEEHGIKVITPTFANTNMDIPSLPASVNAVFNDADNYVIIDVGGDDAGGIALGRYANVIKQSDYDLFYVINERRFLTKDASEAVELLSEIEAVTRVKATKIINNTNLGEKTTLDTVVHSFDFAKKVSEETKLPVAFHCIKEDLDKKKYDFYPVTIFVKTIWSD
ncbi:MAG: P-loop NTPase [Oscillospiraceae bacterium]